MTKAIKKVASGPEKDHGNKWFCQLSDKGLLMLDCMCHWNCVCDAVLASYILVKSTRTHFYFTMKSNAGTEDIFREDLLKVTDHYQVQCLFH